MQKKILILSELFGSGHTKAAEALAQGIAHLEPSIHTQIVEIGKMLHPTRTAFFFRSYKKLITTYPVLWKKIYESKQSQPISQWLQFTIYQLFHRNLEQVLDQIQPDLVICTHPFNSSSLARLKKMGNPIRLCTVITDFHVHGVWVQPEVDLYLVSNDDVRLQLLQMGVPSDRIAVTGIPIKSNFWQKTDKQEARRRLHLKDLPTVMIMGGGLGLGGIQELAHSLIKWREFVQILICTGYNDSLRFTLQCNKHFQHPHIVILGFVDMIDTLLDAADLLITKPGGITCFEALSKGVPMLIFQPIPGHEEYNSNHLVNQELAIRINHQDEVDHWMHKLLSSPKPFEFLHSNMEQYQQKLNPLAGALSIMELLT
ncbi:MGDG synthase family glycosyltransferase [Paenibacillus apiarius]|uniref:MGDG synthase family glycosyltransferase n=1 Tax=Paenibacillus apiarius TaxID=46240 RepID=UPI003B3B9436